MQLREIMTTDVEVIRPETSVSEAAQKMRSLDVGALPVCGGQQVVGMVTDCNITIRATAFGHDPNTTPVCHHMSSDLICCFEDQDIKGGLKSSCGKEAFAGCRSSHARNKSPGLWRRTFWQAEP
jgi:CBS domain-containing protein